MGVVTVVPYTVFPRLSAGSQMSASSRMTAGSKEEIMIMSAQ